MLADDVEKVICQNPGLTAREIAHILFGIDGYHDRVGNTCHALAETGRVERRGRGGPGEPFTYQVL
jgi:hypothetical protein